ncbi:MAG: hypothetical protein JWN76_1567 [Chitinophagaceae bacterium]|nr:hypothetical protein [Chitinophagaceae bacterium]
MAACHGPYPFNDKALYSLNKVYFFSGSGRQRIFAVPKKNTECQKRKV